MFKVNGTVEFSDTETNRTVPVALRGEGESVEAAFEKGLAEGNWRQGIALPIQAALDEAAGRPDPFGAWADDDDEATA